MLAIDIGHDRENRGELQKRSVALVGFGHQVLRFPQAYVVAQVKQYLSNAAHADTAYAYEMNSLNLRKHGPRDSVQAKGSVRIGRHLPTTGPLRSQPPWRRSP